MKQGTSFSFESYSIDSDSGVFAFSYRTDFADGTHIRFTERLDLPDIPLDTIDTRLLTRIFENLHLALGISYYKLHCPPAIRLGALKLNAQQAQFWETLYTKGLGEFFYRNNIDPRGLIRFPATEQEIISPISYQSDDTLLVGMGGGKDSLVSMELLKRAGRKQEALIIETNREYGFVRKLLSKTGLKQVRVSRTIDDRIGSLVKEGNAYDGHVPVSALYAFIGLLVSALRGRGTFVVSNEKSANYGNAEHFGMEVNHQWSKSLEFETLMNRYVSQFVTPSFSYVSLVRPLWEIQIVQLFAQIGKYFEDFSSCNRNFRKDKGIKQGTLWCGTCAKCAFMYALLSAFLPKDTVDAVFKRNLYEDITLLPLYQELLGLKNVKPFDCVGTPDEVRLAMMMASSRGEYRYDDIMKYFETEVLRTGESRESLEARLLASPDTDALPAQFRDVLHYET